LSLAPDGETCACFLKDVAEAGRDARERPAGMGRNFLTGVRVLIAAGRSRTVLTYFAHDFRTDLLIRNELALKCTPFRAAKRILFPVPAEASKPAT
jgi:hypothetical protein